MAQMKNELESQAEELEQTLQKQLELFKKDSEEWLKVGGAVLAGGLLAFAIVKASKRKKENRTQQALEVLEREGLLDNDLRKKITKPKKSSFWPSMSQRLLILGLTLAKEKFFKDLLNPDDHEKNAKQGL